MYIAELHGKLSRDNENKEDILTSNVFSFFKYAPRDIFLYRFVTGVLGLDITKEEARDAEFRFWPSYEDHTEPDVVIIVGDYYLLFEAKLYSDFSKETLYLKHQLVREYEGGSGKAKSEQKKFKLITVTAHYHEKADIFVNVPAAYRKDCLSRTWHRIAFLISTILEEDTHLTEEINGFADDLFKLFQRKNLRLFAGTKGIEVRGLLNSIGENAFFNSKTSNYRGKFFGFINNIESEKRISYPGLNDTKEQLFIDAGKFLIRSDYNGILKDFSGETSLTLTRDQLDEYSHLFFTPTN